ncbi:MAG: hypothetical protein KDL87_14120, partial [Verrucomicrobiae bacterium]|nr:hypothetical protein [Verrucomicrobiae bacterium]
MLDLSERPAVPGASLALDREWRQLRELLGGDDREKLRQLTDRLSTLEQQLATLEEEEQVTQSHLARLRPALAIAAGIALLAAGAHLWKQSQIGEAVSALTGVPGVTVIDTSTGWWFGKSLITGLRDPLGPKPEDILTERGLNPRRFQFAFNSVASMETQWSEQRGRDQARQIEAMRQEMVSVIGDLDQARETLRRRDLEVLTRAVFELRFPEAVGQATLFLDNDRWKVRGNLDEPLYSQLIGRLPELDLGGSIDTSELCNTTPESLQRLQTEIEGVTLVYLSGTRELSEDGHRQAERLVRLLNQHDDLSKKLGQTPAAIEVHALPVIGDSEENRALEASRIEQAQRLIRDGISSTPERLQPGVHDETIQDGRVGIYVTL